MPPRSSVRPQNKQFITVSGKLEFASFRMRSRSLRLADPVMEEVRFLPLQYEQSAYFDFLTDYGTHYTRSGKLGGEYKLVYVLDQDVMTRKDVTEKGLKECLTVDVKLDITGSIKIFDLGLSGHVKPHNCKNIVTTTGGTTQSEPAVAKVIVSAKGGDPEATAAMETKINQEGTMDTDTYAAWARSVLNNPAVIQSE
ncbi:hypothetical protein CRUP_006382, partial [Coryphaenoides rupestris]